MAMTLISGQSGTRGSCGVMGHRQFDIERRVWVLPMQVRTRLCMPSRDERGHDEGSRGSNELARVTTTETGSKGSAPARVRLGSMQIKGHQIN